MVDNSTDDSTDGSEGSIEAPDIRDLLYEDENVAESVFEPPPRQFWPAGIIEKLVTVATIREVLDKANRIYDDALVDYILNICKKPFVVAAASARDANELLQMVKCFEKHKFQNNDLSPEIEETGSTHNDRRLDPIGELFARDPKLWRPSQKLRFRTTQWQAMVPIFSTKTSSYSFKSSTILPFIKFNQSFKSGAFGRVFEAKYRTS
jgi:hypothetical protein